MPYHAATATLPGLPFGEAIERIVSGIDEPLLGTLNTEQIQLCPQSRGQLTNAACEDLAARYPHVQFRLHANARIMQRLVMFDASTLTQDTLPLYQAVAERSRYLHAPTYTLHAGYRKNATLAQMIDNVKRLQDIMGIPVGVEGLYPRADRPQLMDSWAEYEAVMHAGIPMAVDLSHLNIIATHEGWRPDLVAAMLSRPETIEVHFSSNGGQRDSHSVLKQEPWWWHLRHVIHSRAAIFSEGNQLRGLSTPRECTQGYKEV